MYGSVSCEDCFVDEAFFTHWALKAFVLRVKVHVIPQSCFFNKALVAHRAFEWLDSSFMLKFHVPLEMKFGRKRFWAMRTLKMIVRVVDSHVRPKTRFLAEPFVAFCAGVGLLSRMDCEVLI